MIVDFNSTPDLGKAWIFPSSRKFYPKEIDDLKKRIEAFLNSWGNLDDSLNCSYTLKHNRFLIIIIDDLKKPLSLEAHDTLTSFIQSLENSFEITLLDRMNVCYKQGEFVQYKDLKDFKKMIKNKGVSRKTTVFNNMITTKAELEYDWEINIMDSWLGRFVKL